MELTVTGSGNGVQVSDAAFGKEFNESLVHQVVTAYLAAGRQGSVKQKTRSEVSGGGKKPWRQKGTGRARAGTIRSPIWRGGGTTFAARPRDYSQKVNRKMYRGALRSILSELVRQERLVVVDSITPDQPRTKVFNAKLQELGVQQDALIVSDSVERNLELASRNIPNVAVSDVRGVDPVSLVAHNHVVVTVDALKKFEEMLG
ncbi:MULTISPECIES: 50S ribosomal protein L4 [Gammaproteobacteria]|jgi:large subunit ribosomal protein L4|uniref:Large ribosomal subunit protein uL4 n=1 Tax=Vreelandella halophila TaxID=86177 RepID=A0A9X4YDB0_9GAMM|nr:MULTISPECIES: 50S ribosomal protein L4 [Gammaproteobacteria]KAA8982593.1 50S ribosomal protein L4 [Halospina sp. K52047b]MYL27591.1 50S ribosomal protein L4 [Halomonas utahensis]MYL75928.1 50S ribosomal protein L4 [Halomonas sp. 22501_18_FS]